MSDVTAVLAEHLDGSYGAVRDQVRELLTDPLFHPRAGMTRDEHQERVWEQLGALAEAGLSPALGYPETYGGAGDLGAGIAAFETLAFGSLSLLVKAGVQWGLFGGAIQNLGTERHHRTYLADIADLTLPGCFAMTEVGHGSDVQSLATTATYDAADDTLVINTPEPDATKDYIGNAARDGRAAVVFAQLVTAAGSHGVHAVVVPIRDDAGAPLPGVTIDDDGPKAGLNGVDNGSLAFDNVHVPRAICSIASATSTTTAPTRARSRTRRAASSRCSGPWSPAGAASLARRSAPPRSP
ncbi:MAG: acyl-CoA dehydrogenase family protein [Euzebya tangerina]|nr:acyl-CoA dehydrogenase family protein [Euzebya tangerina]